MLYSMTGFGRHTQIIGGYEILVEIKAVNHRYFEFSSRITRAYSYLEDKLKALVASKASRGKIEVSVFITQVEANDTQIQVNDQVANGYIQALRAYGEAAGVPDDLSLSAVARFNDVFTVRKVVADEEAVWEYVSTVALQALDNFTSMRAAEGAKMVADISSRLDTIEQTVAQIEVLSQNSVNLYRQRLTDKLHEVLQDKNIDEHRILTEAAIFAEKVAVDEETVRLRCHITHFREFLQANEPIGRKLDFLVQEINRETNTIGSKCQEIEISRLVVDTKAEIEKIREQIQNIE